MINPLHLRAFNAVAEAGSFTGAARRSAISQPTLSEQVKSLEARFEVSLFTRSGRSIRLTALGERLYQVTRRLARLELEADRLLSDAQDLHTGELRLAASAPVHAVPIFAELERQHPGLRVMLSSGNSEQVVAEVLDQQADVAITADPGTHAGLHAEPLMRNDLVAIVPTDHPLAHLTALPAARLVAERLVLREPQSMTRRRFTTAVAAVELALGDVLTVDTREAVHVAVREGIGIGISAEREVPDDPRVVARPVADLDLAMTEYLVCLQDRRNSEPVRTGFAVAHQVIGDTH
ncbi:LysR substrate-binding domain-containing protein [Microlunatus soli]|uniref:Aminoethylphosphonate catabolism associated LysR family transcriptional regulator n=1 Tax=Microlunatus soli TaxID=630515 RepID=A0A1H1WHJ3_9ACTN|nr:LysR substrate-binding domain-containing protein [Microlunatus soli]SDS96565.1 aminoethylphosphonate catabolism associated LysR family transcriptional regulator [Microlunatus soli]